MTVLFQDIGDNKVTFTRDCPGECSEEWIKSQIEPLVKSICWCVYNGKRNIGVINSGWELVGYYKIV